MLKLVGNAQITSKKDRKNLKNIEIGVVYITALIILKKKTIIVVHISNTDISFAAVVVFVSFLYSILETEKKNSNKFFFISNHHNFLI